MATHHLIIGGGPAANDAVVETIRDQGMPWREKRLELGRASV